MRTWLLLGFCPALAACATLQYAETNVYPEPIADKALVYFYRVSKFTGSGLQFRIHDGEKRIGAVGNRSYFYYLAEPGEHRFWSTTEARDELIITLEPNETYYTSVEARWGAFVGRPRLTVEHQLEGVSRVKQLRYGTGKVED